MPRHEIPGISGLDAHSIFCIGRNFVEHAKELGNAVPAEPVVFLKPLSSLVTNGGPLILPSQSVRVDHEVEIVVAIGKSGKHLTEAQALSHVAGYAVGVDATARDIQDELKKKSLPWTLAKGFDSFAQVSAFVPSARIPDPGALVLEFRINGATKQSGSAAQMIFSIPKLIAWLSSRFTLSPGDLIFTGTPKGVGPMRPGDVCEGRLLESDGKPLTKLSFIAQSEAAT